MTVVECGDWDPVNVKFLTPACFNRAVDSAESENEQQ